MLELAIDLSQDGRNIFELDSAEINTVATIEENSKGLAGTKARNILEFNNGQNFCNCPEINDSTGLKSGAMSTNSFKQMSGISLTVEPNPARQWTAFNYSLPFESTTGEISITDASAKVVEIFAITGKQGQRIWDTRKVNSGVYFYTLTINGNSKTGKIVVSK